MTERFERLNALAEINNASTYLEVGVADGDTFNQVNVAYKVGVDPVFGFDIVEQSRESIIFHDVTSDVFFSQLAGQHKPFDLIYLDGLHTFEQTFRDFCASLKYSHANTIWLIDDTSPTSPLAAIPNLQMSLFLRERLRIRDRRWMGDVYKAVFAIHDFFPQFSYATFPGHGQTVIWNGTRPDFMPTWNSFQKISRLNYRSFLKYKESHLLLAEPSQILETIEKSRSGSLLANT